MEQSELLRIAVGALDELGLRYFVTGSVATIFYGEPRFTNDVDLVVDLPPTRVAEFCQKFPLPEFYVSQDAALQAAVHHGQFNIIHPESGLKIDVVVPEKNPFNQGRFLRAARVRPSADLEAMFASPEDVIIKKMQYYREGGSEKHLRDIAGILKISGDKVDKNYIARWATLFGVDTIWQAILEELAG
jgi:hypothetical protein